MGDDVQELLVRPDVMFLWRDVEITGSDQGNIVRIAVFKPCADFIDEAELVREFIVDIRVGFVAACGNVEIMQFKIGKLDRDVAAILFADPVMDLRVLKGVSGRDGHAVITFHALNVDVWVSGVTDVFCGEKFIRAFGFLQADQIRLLFAHEAKKQREPQADRINIPCQDPHGSIYQNGMFMSPGRPRLSIMLFVSDFILSSLASVALLTAATIRSLRVSLSLSFIPISSCPTGI